jgi:two-component system, chemotaxis family, protein-glutamate methylesterase/glutaminase
MGTRDVVVVGASAGGIEALRSLAAGLPAEFPASVLVVLHVPPHGVSALPVILNRSGQLPARHARDGERLQRGQVYVAPPDRHLAVTDNRVTLSVGPRENGHRPAADVLFRSAARALGPRVIGVVLSGALDDGTAGLHAIRGRGGLVVAQDPADALQPAMPRSAIVNVPPDYVVPASELADLLGRLVQEVVDEGAAPAPPSLLQLETDISRFDTGASVADGSPAMPSGFTCPDCGGALLQIEEGDLLRFRCRVGHAWSAESLSAQQHMALEAALWMALRSLEEKAALTRQMAGSAHGEGRRFSAERFQTAAEEAGQAARLLRGLLEKMGSRDEGLTAEPATGTVGPHPRTGGSPGRVWEGGT